MDDNLCLIAGCGCAACAQPELLSRRASPLIGFAFEIGELRHRATQSWPTNFVHNEHLQGVVPMCERNDRAAAD
jgi:hypothetical protein